MGAMFWGGVLVLFLALCVYFMIVVNRLLSLNAKWKEKRAVRIGIKAGIYVLVVLLVGLVPASFAFVFYAAVTSLLMEPLYALLRKRKVWAFLRKSALIPILVGVIATVIGLVMMRHVVRTDYTVLTDRLESGEEVRILFLSDLHYGNSLHKAQLDKLVQIWNNENFDAVIIGGDLVDESTKPAEMREIVRALGSIQSRYGCFFIYGNHDRMEAGGRRTFSNDEFVSEMTANGIAVLEDEYAMISPRIRLYGRKDRSEHRTDMNSLTNMRETDGFLIIADHQPNDLKKEAKAGADLTLCGHTHAGQFWPIGLIHEPFGFNDLYYGCRQYDGMTAIVSSGMSGWYAPVRTEGRSEYVVITVKGK